MDDVHDDQIEVDLFGAPVAPLPRPVAPVAPVTTGIRRVPVVSVRLWAGNPRSHKPFDAVRDADLVRQIGTHGQKVPCIVRPLPSPDAFELIAGCRRYGCVACLTAADPTLMLLVEVREMDDQEAFVIVDAENGARKDVSPHQRARYQDWALKTLFDGSQTALARKLDISTTTLSRSLDLVRLPQEVMALIRDLDALTPNMVAKWLGPACSKPDRCAAVVEAARTLGADGATYGAGKAIGLIRSAVEPEPKVEPVIVLDTASGMEAVLAPGSKGAMVVTVPVAGLAGKPLAAFLKQVAAAMPGFAAALTDTGPVAHQ